MEKKLVISEIGKENIERLALTIHVGLLTLLKENIISIDEADSYFFSPYSAMYLESLGVDEALVDLIWHTCELENTESLMPERLPEMIDKRKNEALEMLKKLPRYPKYPNPLGQSIKKWIDWIEQ